MSLERLVNREMARRHIPGLSLAVVRAGKLLHQAGYGVANLEWETPVTPTTRFEIASLTKLFTATAVVLLAEEGRLALTDTLDQHLTRLPAAWRPITIAHCLSHQSGIRSYTAVDAYWQRTREDKTPQEILDLVADLPLDFEPGRRFAYDNTGYYLLGLLLEQVTGQPYGEVLARRIFRPLRMADTMANEPDAVVARRAAGYVWQEGRWRNKPYYSPSNTFAAGVLLSTAADMGRWAAALQRGQLLPPAVLAEMWRPRPSVEDNEKEAGFAVGWGWFEVNHDGRTFLGHNGDIVGFSSALVHYRAEDLTVVVLCNLGGVSDPHAVAQAIAGRYFGL